MANYGTVSTMFRKIRASDAAKEYERQLLDPSVPSLSFEDRLCLILDRELAERNSRRVNRLIHEANFRIKLMPKKLILNKIELFLNKQ